MSKVEYLPTLSLSLVFQHPGYVIEFESRHFRADLHVRFHTSAASEVVNTYLWPALLEGRDGPCVHKAVVIT